MKRLQWVLLAAACALANAGEFEAPAVQQALKLLSNLQTQVSEEGKEAEKVFDDEKKLCSGRSRELRHSHEGVKTELAKSDAELAQANIEIDTMSTKIEELAVAIASDENDLKEAQKLRDEEASVFVKEEQGLMSTVDALDRALAIVGHEQRKVYKSQALLQMESTATPLVEALSAVVEASAVGAADRQRLQALIQSSQTTVATEDAEDADVDAALGVEPSPVAYSSKSGNLVAVLNEVLEKAQGELEKLRSEEQEKLHSFQLLKQSLESKMKYLNRDMASAQELQTEASQKKATAEKNYEAAKKSMSEAAGALQDLQESCLKKASEFEKDMQARAEEVQALQEAKNAISSKMGSDVSFLQVGRARGVEAASESAERSGAAAAARSVRRLAVKLDSPVLVELAGRLDYAAGSHLARFGGEDPFKKVRGLIEGMIGHLQSEARAEADHQAFCDKEMSVTGIKSADKQDDVDKLGTKIEQGQARLTHLTEQTATLREELTDLAKTQLEMDEVGALLGLSAAVVAPSRSEAFEMPNLAQFFSTVVRVVTTGTNEAFDPTTEEGAQALGLASPLPKEGFGEITLDDVLPFALFLLVLVVWGLLVVPSSMDRSDGAKSVLFPSQVPKLQVYVPDAVKALPAEAPILKSRRLRDPDGELLLPLKEAKRPKKGKSPAGFNRSKK